MNIRGSDSAGLSRLWIGAAAACVLLGGVSLLWHGALPFEGLVRMAARVDAWDQAVSMTSDPETLRRFYRFSVAAAFLCAGLCIAAGTVWLRLEERGRDVIWRLGLTLASSCALILYLFRMGVDGPWAPVGEVMSNPGALPIYGHRLLFVWVAKAFQRIAPGLSPLRAFYLSQCVAILLAVFALGKWSALHGGKALGWVGQVLGVILLSLCFRLHNFYDIGTVFVTTCGLQAIYTRRYWWLVPVCLIGTLNYEGVLLLIPLAAFLAYDTEPPKKWIPAVAASLAVYGAIRLALQAAIPFPRHVDWRIWSNMSKPFLFGQEMAYTLLALAGWYAVGWMSWGYCDSRLKRMALLFPLLCAVTFLFGQLHEARQFDALIPVLVAMIVTASKKKAELALAR